MFRLDRVLQVYDYGVDLKEFVTKYKTNAGLFCTKHLLFKNSDNKTVKPVQCKFVLIIHFCKELYSKTLNLEISGGILFL